MTEPIPGPVVPKDVPIVGAMTTEEQAAQVQMMRSVLALALHMERVARATA